MVKKILKRSEMEDKKNLEERVKQEKRTRSLSIASEEGGIIGRRSLEAKDKAEVIITEAMKEADEIKKRAQKILDEIAAAKEKAQKDGFASGREAGFSQVTQMLVKLESVRERFYSEAEGEIIKLVTAIAEKVIGDIVNENPGVIKGVVKQALERSLGDRITVKLNPHDYKVLSEGNFEFKDVLDRTKRLHFKEDETIAKGGCVVETEVGTIDAQIETQLEAIKKALEI